MLNDKGEEVEAIKENYKCSGICQVCRGISKTAGGFIWKYA